MHASHHCPSSISRNIQQTKKNVCSWQWLGEIRICFPLLFDFQKHEENVAPSGFLLVDNAKFKRFSIHHTLVLDMAFVRSEPNLTTTMQELLEPVLVIDRQIYGLLLIQPNLFDNERMLTVLEMPGVAFIQHCIAFLQHATEDLNRPKLRRIFELRRYLQEHVRQLNRVPYDHVGSSDDEMVELLMMPRRMWARRCASLTFCTAFFLFWLLVVKARNCLSAACGKGEELLLLGKLALKMLWAEQHELYVFAYCKVLPAYPAVFRSQIYVVPLCTLMLDGLCFSIVSMLFWLSRTD